MPDWLAFVNAWASLPLAFVGFWIAIVQIRKTRKVADAAKLAAMNTESKIVGNLLLVVLPQLAQTETNLEWAIGKNDATAAMHYLGSWRWQAGQVKGHLLSQSDAPIDLLSMIQTSITTAADTKLSLQVENVDIKKRSKAAQQAIAAVTGQIGELSARNSTEGTTTDATI